MINKFSALFKQAVKYGLVGVINTLITWVIIFVLMNGFGLSYKISNAVGYIAGFINSFIMNKKWTFSGKREAMLPRESTLRQLTKFGGVFAICYVLQLGLVILLVENLQMSENLSQIIGMVFYTGIGFLFNKIFTFKQ